MPGRLASLLVAGGVGLLGPYPVGGQATARPVLVELFTSEGCSSCPPADALLRELSTTRADVLPLAFHVTYWDNLGWRDPFAFEGATSRQRGYARTLPSEVYTPQLLVDGRRDVVGSDRRGVLVAIGAAAATQPDAVATMLHRRGGDVAVTIGPGSGIAQVLVIGYDPEHTTEIARGENAGRRLVEANVVRGIEVVARWTGAPLSLRHAALAGERLVVVLQAEDGRVVGLARESPDEG